MPKVDFSRSYFLFYSTHCFTTTNYDIKYATSTSVKGPYTRANASFKETGDNGLTAPGGFTALPGGGLAVSTCQYTATF